MKWCYDRRSIGQSVLVSGTHLGPMARFLLLSVAGLLMRGTLSGERTSLELQLLLGFTSAVILGSEPRRTHDHILLSHIRKGQGPECISPRNRVDQLYPQAVGFFSVLVMRFFSVLVMRLFNVCYIASCPPPPTSDQKSKLCYDRLSVG
jgi:hypothetical protein